MKKKNRRKYFREFVAKNPKISIGAKSRTLFILSFTQLIQRGRLADLKKHSFQIEGFMGASINNQTKTQKLHKKNGPKIKKKTRFKTTAFLPPNNSNPFKRTLTLSILLCFMTFVHQLQLLSPFAAWEAVLLALRPGKVQA